MELIWPEEEARSCWKVMRHVMTDVSVTVIVMGMSIVCSRHAVWCCMHVHHHVVSLVSSCVMCFCIELVGSIGTACMMP